MIIQLIEKNIFASQKKNADHNAFTVLLENKMNSLRYERIQIQCSTFNTNDDFVKGCPTLNSDCDVWDPILCACLVCKTSYMYTEPQHETSNYLYNDFHKFRFVFLIKIINTRI